MFQWAIRSQETHISGLHLTPSNTSLTKKQALHATARTVASHLIANRVVFVLCGALGHFLLLFLPLSDSSVGQYRTECNPLKRTSPLHKKCHCLVLEYLKRLNVV